MLLNDQKHKQEMEKILLQEKLKNENPAEQEKTEAEIEKSKMEVEKSAIDLRKAQLNAAADIVRGNV
mgnify:FL=1